VAGIALLAAVPLAGGRRRNCPRIPSPSTTFVAMRSLSELTCAPDGRQAAYVASMADVKADKRRSAIWLADLQVRLPCS